MKDISDRLTEEVRGVLLSEPGLRLYGPVTKSEMQREFPDLNARAIGRRYRHRKIFRLNHTNYSTDALVFMMKLDIASLKRLGKIIDTKISDEQERYRRLL